MHRWLILILLTLVACQTGRETALQISSPDKSIVLSLALENGSPVYQVSVDGKTLIRPSSLGIALRNQPDFSGPYKLVDHELNAVNESWETVWGQEKHISNHFNGMKILLQESSSTQRYINLHFRAFNDGIAFRYEIPRQAGIDSLFITEERTEFKFSSDAEAWWNEGTYLFDTPEQLYYHTNLSSIDSANTPVTCKTEDGLYISIHEANLTDYAGMILEKDTADPLKFYTSLVPWPDGDKVKTRTPLLTPWRTITIGRNAADLLRSRMILNLNEPNILSDVSWIKPMKYIGIWWGMHINKYTWTQGDRHGATTENTMAYIDFAAKNNIQGVLTEGWNQGWEDWGQDDALNLTTPYDDFDIEAVTKYARDNGVSFIGHHETTANVRSYERQLEDAFAFYADLGIRAVKTGYVGPIKPAGQYHYGQWMVQHFRRVVETAARYNITLDVHEPVKGTGIERTWPNMMTREGGRGQEYNAWSEGNPPNHTTILPFTRLLAGPMDYTPGIFDITFDGYKPENRVHSTLAKQLALMVVLYSPLQMAADLPENYQGQPAFQFVRDLATDWEETRILSAEIGEEVTIARKWQDEWFIGSITNEVARELAFPLSEMIQDSVVAECYADTKASDFKTSPTTIMIASYLATPGDSIKVRLAPGGGLAIRLRPMNANDYSLPLVFNLHSDQLK